MKSLIRIGYRIGQIAFFTQILVLGLILILSFFSKSIDRLFSVAIDHLAPWLLGTMAFLVLINLLGRRGLNQPHEPSQQWLKVLCAIGIFAVALDATFGWSSRIEPFELRIAFHGAFLVIVAVLGVIALINSRRKSG